MVSRIRSCADRLGGGWERNELPRTANRHDGGHGDGVGLRLLVHAAVILTAKSLPPQPDTRPMARKEAHRGEKILAALRPARIRSSIVCFQPLAT